jgi:hypothetical protein
MARLLKRDGIVVIEVPSVKELIENRYFDTIYHEHVSYFSLNSLEALFRRNNLKVIDVEQRPIHGGTLRVTAGHQSQPVSPRVERVLAEEMKAKVHEPEFYTKFGTDVSSLRKELVALLRGLKERGKRIAAYGASAKGSTLLNYCGIGLETVEYVVDQSPIKQGRFTPGSIMPIYPPARLLSDRPDYTLLLTWNFADEILEQQAEYRRQGGKFIIPVPEPHLI